VNLLGVYMYSSTKVGIVMTYMDCGSVHDAIARQGGALPTKDIQVLYVYIYICVCVCVKNMDYKNICPAHHTRDAVGPALYHWEQNRP
jgi:hypothetical protein